MSNSNSASSLRAVLSVLSRGLGGGGPSDVSERFPRVAAAVHDEGIVAPWRSTRSRRAVANRAAAGVPAFPLSGGPAAVVSGGSGRPSSQASYHWQYVCLAIVPPLRHIALVWAGGKKKTLFGGGPPSGHSQTASLTALRAKASEPQPARSTAGTDELTI